MNEQQFQQFNAIRKRLTRFMMMYKFALSEIETKIEILQEEFQMLHDYNPIEHTKSRVKSPDSLMKKIYRKGGVGSLDEIRETIRDIAGIRITCSFVSDIYLIARMLESQSDLRIIDMKDYIASPKPNGYRSLHLIVEVPVFMSDRQEHVYVEVQIRTIAMDFWASLEHKIFYKYNEDVPQRLLNELKETADASFELDQQMERLRHEIEEVKNANGDAELADFKLLLGNQKFVVPDSLLRLLGQGTE